MFESLAIPGGTLFYFLWSILHLMVVAAVFLRIAVTMPLGTAEGGGVMSAFSEKATDFCRAGVFGYSFSCT